MILSPLPKLAFLGNNGRPLEGGLLFTYVAGTTTKITTYTDSGGGTPNTNPIVLDYRGEANVWLDATKTYKFVLSPRGDTDPPTNPIWTVDNISPLGGQQTIGQILYPQTAEEAAAGITPVDYTQHPRTMTRYSGVLADGGTDCTAALLTVANAMGGTFTVPYNVKFDTETLLTSLDTDVVFIDDSQINDYTNAGQTAKTVGIISSDTSADDSSWNIRSGHHPGLTLNNFGTSGTSSATRRVASIDWMSGQFQNGVASLHGGRFAGNNTFQKHPSLGFWNWNVFSFAPWLAIAGNYENWEAAEVISGAGVYRVNGANMYVSAGAGTTAAPGPTNTSGTAPDGGGVQWTWIYTVGTTLLSLDEYARLLIGTNSVGSQFEAQTSVTDPGGGDYAMVLRPSGASKKTLLKGFATTAGSAQSAQPYWQWQDTVGMRAMRSTAAGSVWRFTDTGVLIEDTVSDSRVNVADGDATPSVLGSRLFFISNSGATNITALDDGVDGQEVEFFTDNGNTTFVNAITLMLQGGVNVTLTAYSVITFRKVPNAISNRWIEVSRSIK